jgi:DNA-directed RNA polymerase specialized sigma24 family protein
MDHLRRKFGRDSKMKALERLAPAERRLFRLYYIEGLSPRDVVARLELEDGPWTDDRFLAALHEVEKKLGDRWLKRLAYDLHAQSVGAASGRLLEYLDHVRDEFDQRAGAYSPEYYIMQREAQRTIDHLRSALMDLSATDRRLLELRFERGWTARRIASELGVTGPRRVYSMIERLVNGLRRQLLKHGSGGT